MKGLVAYVFMNGLGNFIFCTAAIKILKQWGYQVDLITDQRFLSSPALKEVSEGIFNEIRIDYDKEKYVKTFLAFWSIPQLFRDRFGPMRPKIINWNKLGIHEVQLYLDTIGANWEDFDGYILDPVETDFEPRTDTLTIALANCASANHYEKLNIGDKKKKRYPYFPELSRLLISLGYEVVLLGLTDELDDCEGINFVDQLSVRETADVIKKCDLLIAPSTGSTIIADAVGTPVMLLEGPMQTARAHPITVPYTIVREYLSCAPCFQKAMWKMCTESICMQKLTPNKVIRKLNEFLPRLKHKSVVKIKPLSINPEPVLECNRKVAYLVSCYNRYHILKVFLESFKDSNPVDGEIFFLDDDSDDPRIWRLLNDFLDVSTLKGRIFLRDPNEKRDVFESHHVNPSIHAYNKLIEGLYQELEKGNNFDYVIIIDPDILMKPNWVQKMIQLYELNSDLKIGMVSPFNTNHPLYDKEGMSETQDTIAGSFRLRDGCNLPYMLSIDVLQNDHKFFSLKGFKSSDIGKSREMNSKGFSSLITVPSLVEHFGAYATNGRHAKGVITSEDFYESTVSHM